ncbi:hypothetical protein Hdeb2414_s0006g00211391 [Helianthus debilis subsp. tardiflorus]
MSNLSFSLCQHLISTTFITSLIFLSLKSLINIKENKVERIKGNWASPSLHRQQHRRPYPKLTITRRPSPIFSQPPNQTNNHQKREWAATVQRR